ncbi:MAG TPA: AarF/ABC1/UbiB kinase family protein [Pirellulaceae bacterium]|jgi:ubiquinone biosynthesis protein|nr:AarF/ABC1/UbiB kinase family protein [Pirellulaceae bacterium]
MKFSAIPQTYRNVKRAGEIFAVLGRNGFGDWLARAGAYIDSKIPRRQIDAAVVGLTFEARVRKTLVELGPTFVKLGQIASTRPDVFGVRLAEELRGLQSNVPADPFPAVRTLIERELGQPLEDVFLDFDEEPIASASIGQVHRARLLSGQEVVVKVQHIDIEATVNADLEILAALARLAERLEDFAAYRPVATAAEIARTIRRELDFGREERQLQQFGMLYDRLPTVRIPTVDSELCTGRVVTMERLDGVSVAEREKLIVSGANLDEVARRIGDVYVQMIFRHGYYHADPHPGNVLVLPGNVIGLLDFGMVGRIDERLREDIQEMLLAIAHRDVQLLTSILRRIGEVPFDVDVTAFSIDVTDFVDSYSTVSLSEFDVAAALSDMVEIIRRHRITLPSQVGLLIKTLVTLEGTVKALSPGFSLMEALEPMQRTLMLERLSPRRHLRKLRRFMYEAEQLAEYLPQRLMDILQQIQLGRFDVHLDHRRLGPTANRLVLAMLTSSLILAGSILLSQQVPPVLFPTNTYAGGMHRVSLWGVAAMVLSMLLGIRLFVAMNRSGNLDEDELRERKRRRPR